MVANKDHIHRRLVPAPRADLADADTIRSLGLEPLASGPNLLPPRSNRWVPSTYRLHIIVGAIIDLRRAGRDTLIRDYQPI